MINRLGAFVNEETSGWKKIELGWLFIACFVILGLSLYWKDSLMGIICALTGVICVITTGKGKMSCYLFGLVNTILYAIIALGAKYYGEVMLNLLYFVPMQFVGWFMWRQHMNHKTQEVVKEKMQFKYQISVTIITVICVYLYGLMLEKMGGNMPYVDSTSTVLSVAAMILSVKRYMEQWILWIVVNIVTIIMWIGAFFTGGESVATLLMWIVYLVNAIIMFVKWYRESIVIENSEVKLNV